MVEVNLKQGLYLVQTKRMALKSNGLSKDEYIIWHPHRGICYEDGCIIGLDYERAFSKLDSLEWTHNHSFYFESDEFENHVKESVKDLNDLKSAMISKEDWDRNMEAKYFFHLT